MGEEAKDTQSHDFMALALLLSKSGNIHKVLRITIFFQRVQHMLHYLVTPKLCDILYLEFREFSIIIYIYNVEDLLSQRLY